MEVARVVTPYTRVELARALRDGHALACGGPPSLSRWAGMCGQLFLEQGNGAKTNNNNFGNITASEAWREKNDYFGMAVPPPDPPHLWFRAYPSAVAGARAYVEILLGRYAAAVRCMDHGDYAGACAALKARGYMTADLGPYSRAVVSLANGAALTLLPPLLGEDDRPAVACDTPDRDGELRGLVDVAAFNLTDLARDDYDEARAEYRETLPDH